MKQDTLLHGEVPQQSLQPGLQIDHRGLQLEPQFEPVGIDPFQVDYSSQLAPPSMDSPNFNVDYNQQVVVTDVYPSTLSLYCAG